MKKLLVVFLIIISCKTNTSSFFNVLHSSDYKINLEIRDIESWNGSSWIAPCTITDGSKDYKKYIKSRINNTYSKKNVRYIFIFRVEKNST